MVICVRVCVRVFVCELAMFVYVLWLCILFKVVSPLCVYVCMRVCVCVCVCVCVRARGFVHACVCVNSLCLFMYCILYTV